MENEFRGRFQLQLVATLTKAMGTRDIYTENHQNAVSGIARRLAQKLDLSSNEIEGIRLAGLLHDIGKFAIPVELLTKAGPLIPQEFALIQTHVIRGVELLEGIDLPAFVISIIEQHHERLDGSGYPNSLQGGDVCTGARIIGVADTLDAMVNARPYRKARGIETTMSMFEKDAGQQYDPLVVSALWKLLETEDEKLKRHIPTMED